MTNFGLACGLEIANGSISDRAVVRESTRGITHVIHCATSKETQESVIDVSIKGLFGLLEECRRSNSFKEFNPIGGDAAVGHCVYLASGLTEIGFSHRTGRGCVRYEWRTAPTRVRSTASAARRELAGVQEGQVDRED